jgi:3-mercaptopyruvate sulfurtransferase SseA
MKPKLVFFILFAVLFCVSYAFSFERFEVITTKELKNLLEDRKEGKVDFILVNALDEMIFRDGHIPESINVPLGKTEKYSSRLGNDKNKLIITH